MAFATNFYEYKMKILTTRARLCDSSLRSRGTEPSRTAFRFRQTDNLFQLGVEDPLADKLRNPIAAGHLELVVGMVEQDHPQVATIVLVHDAGTDIDKVLHGQTRAGRHPTVATLRQLNLDVGHNQLLAAGRNGVLVGAAERGKTVTVRQDGS